MSQEKQKTNGTSILIIKRVRGNLKNYKIQNNELYFQNPITVYNPERKWVFCIPKEAHKQAIEEEHDLKSHPGSWKTVARLKNTYHWPKLYEDTYQYVSNCEK